jgi:hypothetical protein
MAALTRRTWYLAALTLATGAIAAQLIGKHYAGLGMTTMGRAAEALSLSKRYADSGMDAQARAAAHESGQLKPVARRYVRRAGVWGSISLVLALVAAAYWPLAPIHHESGTRRMLLALVVVYLLLLLLVV